MKISFSALKETLLVDVPQLPTWLKIVATLLLITIAGGLLTAVWRKPAIISELDPVTTTRLETGVLRFFLAYDQRFGDSPAEVFGEAKDIVRRFADETGVFSKVESEIEATKRNDPNWSYANRKQAGLYLVNSLGLTDKTVKQNEIFLELSLPEGVKTK